MNKRLIATILAAVMVLPLASCSKEEDQATEAPATVTEAPVTEAGKETWEGKWKSSDTEEYMEIYEVSETGLKVHFYHEEEGDIALFDYEMEFDDEEKTVASQPGDADANGGWEYTFVLGKGQLTVKSKHPDQIYYRAD